MRTWFVSINSAEDCLADTAARSREALKLGRYPTDEVVKVVSIADLIGRLDIIAMLLEDELPISAAHHLEELQEELEADHDKA